MKIILVCLFTFFSSKAFSSGISTFDHQHTKLAAVLKKYHKRVQKQTFVNYVELKKEPAVLDSYLKELTKVTKKEYKDFNSDQKLSFLINAYNGYTLKLIINHYPVKSIKDIKSSSWNPLSTPWKMTFFKLFGSKMSLDGIEHGIIRKNFKESRIHFAVNCASIGCPSLYREPFVASKLGKQLEAASVWFLSNQFKNRFDSKTKTLHLSKIFKWYGEDFKKSHGSVNKFVAKYVASNAADMKLIETDKVKIKYLDYDWDLNDTK